MYVVTMCIVQYNNNNNNNNNKLAAPKSAEQNLFLKRVFLLENDLVESYFRMSGVRIASVFTSYRYPRETRYGCDGVLILMIRLCLCLFYSFLKKIVV